MLIQILTFIISVMTFGLVELAEIDYTLSNNFPIAELNGLSLNEIFVDYDLLANNEMSIDSNNNGINDLWNSYAGATYSIVDSYQIITVTNTLYSGIAYNLKVNESEYFYINHSYYTRLEYYTDNLNWNIHYNNGIYQSTVDFSLYINQWSEYSNITIYSSDSTSNAYFKFQNYVLTTYLYIDNVYLLDLTDLGIESLTVSQMDDYYDLWVSNKTEDVPYTYTLNTLTQTDLIILISSLSIWALAIIIIKEVL